MFFTSGKKLKRALLKFCFYSWIYNYTICEWNSSSRPELHDCLLAVRRHLNVAGSVVVEFSSISLTWTYFEKLLVWSRCLKTGHPTVSEGYSLVEMISHTIKVMVWAFLWLLVCSSQDPLQLCIRCRRLTYSWTDPTLQSTSCSRTSPVLSVPGLLKNKQVSMQVDSPLVFWLTNFKKEDHSL